MKRTQGPKVNLRNLGDFPEMFAWTEADSWVREMIEKDFARLRKEGGAVQLKAEVVREGKNFRLHGFIALELVPLCDRCGKEFKTRCQQDFQLLLIAPAAHGNLHIEVPRKRETKAEEEESEWGATHEDLIYEDDGSSILKSDEVDLANYFHEQALLALPMTLVCREECPGLCPRCGTDLSHGPCSCAEKPQDARWEALKSFKVKR